MTDTALPRTSLARVQLTQIQCRINDDFAGNYAFTRYGVNIAVVTPDGSPTWEKEVWQRGVWLPVRPFYARRLARAKRKAERIADAHGTGKPSQQAAP